MKNKKYKYSVWTLSIFASLIIILGLTALNIKGYYDHKKVLGTKTQTEVESTFWVEFIATHPNYIPGLIELGDFEKASQIDPNFEE